MTTVLGIEFAPMKLPLERRLQTLGVIYHFMCTFGTPALILLFFVWMLFSGYALVVAAYGVWLWWDWDSPYRGAYASRYFLNLGIHKWFTGYFPLSIHPTADLPADKNYLIGFHPHGVISISAYNFMSNGTGLMDRFPNINFHLCTLVGQFWMPLRREWFMMHGIINCSKQSLNNLSAPLDYRNLSFCSYVLGDARKGQAAVLVVGGAEEALDAHPGQHILTLNKRKGFIKLALENGADLVPCFGFGENDLYLQAANAEGSLVRRFQTAAKRVLGVSPVLFHGRGIFNYTFGLLPFRKQLNTVLGAPIPVLKTENPTQEQIDDLHALYIQKLTELFDSHKEQFGVAADNELIIR
ncbi:hypothetical protein PFISCL1PPCAC_3546 [Pristionchus fissidentatus]|uniref:Acyltransferase n=1 Tax=Pristionchus fissidentatus TaxID=1538716 RepID=A0AAV5V2W1_9BILA|nr:hypothetical protein PFISCL1PPCAC_3546 [Pristionchus fissidentatus]